jgi:hypothetical protein
MKHLLVLFSFLTLFFVTSCIEDKDVTPEETTPVVNQEFPVIEEVSPDGFIGTVELPDSLSVSMTEFYIMDGNNDQVFHINKESGDLYLKDLMQSKDANNEFNLSIQVIDKETGENVLNINLKIILSPDLFIYDTLKQIGYVDEDCEQGYLVGTVASIDTTFKLDFRFDIFRGNQLGIFDLNRQNGQLTLKQPGLINYETDSLHLLHIVVSDHDNPKDSVLYYVNYYVHVNESNTLETGLIGFYPFNNDIHDYSPRENHCLTEGPINYTAGVQGQSVEFNGESDYLEFSETLSPNEMKAFSFWVHSYGPVEGENNGSIISKYDKNLGRSLMINTFGPMNHDFSYNRIGAFYHAGFHYLDGDWVKANYEDFEGEIPNGMEHFWTNYNADTISTTRWHHCVVNLTENKLVVYVDNTVTVTKERSYELYNENNHVPTYIGNTFNGGTGNNNHFHGKLDELRIYDRPLTEEEISQLYHSQQ